MLLRVILPRTILTLKNKTKKREREQLDRIQLIEPHLDQIWISRSTDRKKQAMINVPLETLGGKEKLLGFYINGLFMPRRVSQSGSVKMVC